MHTTSVASAVWSLVSLSTQNIKKYQECPITYEVKRRTDTGTKRIRIPVAFNIVRGEKARNTELSIPFLRSQDHCSRLHHSMDFMRSCLLREGGNRRHIAVPPRLQNCGLSALRCLLLRSIGVLKSMETSYFEEELSSDPYRSREIG